jgi:DNA-binding NarL/FixJ family response regulator
MRILVADDHGIVRSGIKLLLERQADLQVVAEASDGVEAVEQALATHPDLCILDVGMPRKTGLQAAREIRSFLSGTRVLMLSMHDDEHYLFEALKAGAAGYVLKREADQDLVGAVRAVGRGEAFLTNAAERSIIRDWMSGSAAGPAIPLTPARRRSSS